MTGEDYKAMEDLVTRVVGAAVAPILIKLEEHSHSLSDLVNETREHSKLLIHQQVVLNEHSELLGDLDSRVEIIQEDIRELKITVAHDEKRLNSVEKRVADLKKK